MIIAPKPFVNFLQYYFAHNLILLLSEIFFLLSKTPEYNVAKNKIKQSLLGIN